MPIRSFLGDDKMWNFAEWHTSGHSSTLRKMISKALDIVEKYKEISLGSRTLITPVQFLQNFIDHISNNTHQIKTKMVDFGPLPNSSVNGRCGEYIFTTTHDYQCIYVIWRFHGIFRWKQATSCTSWYHALYTRMPVWNLLADQEYLG